MAKKKIILSDSPVLFNEAEHTYTLDEQSLSGITSIIHRYIFPDMYKGVSESILSAAAERGHIIHEQLQMQFMGYELDDPCQEIASFNQVFRSTKCTQIAAEYVISDNHHVATCVDAIWHKKGDEVALVDYKTTRVLNMEYLQWQLSIEKYLFEMQNPSYKVSELFAVHMPKPIANEPYEARIVPVKPLPEEYVIALLDAYISNAESFDNPMRKMSGEMTELLEKYRENELAIKEAESVLNAYRETKQDILAILKQQMDDCGMKEWSNQDGSIKITRKADSIRRIFNIDTLKKNCPDFPEELLHELSHKGYKETVVAGSVVVTFK